LVDWKPRKRAVAMPTVCKTESRSLMKPARRFETAVIPASVVASHVCRSSAFSSATRRSVRSSLWRSTCLITLFV
jgi:hypothetical protein